MVNMLSDRVDSYQKRHSPKTLPAGRRLLILIVLLLLAFVLLGLILQASGAWVALGLILTFILGMFVGVGMRQRNAARSSTTPVAQLPSRPIKSEMAFHLERAMAPEPEKVFPQEPNQVANEPKLFIPVAIPEMVPVPEIPSSVESAEPAPLERKTWKPKAKTPEVTEVTEVPEIPEIPEVPSSVVVSEVILETPVLERKKWTPKAKTEVQEVIEIPEISPSAVPLERKKWTPKAKTETPLEVIEIPKTEIPQVEIPKLDSRAILEQAGIHLLVADVSENIPENIPEKSVPQSLEAGSELGSSGRAKWQPKKKS
jgi:hypothetical protein